MLVKDLLDIFAVKRKNEKSDFYDNIHKSYEAYRFIEENYSTLNVEDIYENLSGLYEALKQKYKPTTIRNYVRFFKQSLDLDYVKENVSEDILNKAKEDIRGIIKKADKEANIGKPKPKSKQSSESEAEELDVELHEIVHVAQQSSNSEQELNMRAMETENKMLREQVTWLQRLIETMVGNHT